MYECFPPSEPPHHRFLWEVQDFAKWLFGLLAQWVEVPCAGLGVDNFVQVADYD